LGEHPSKDQYPRFEGIFMFTACIETARPRPEAEQLKTALWNALIGGRDGRTRKKRTAGTTSLPSILFCVFE
jgi:hypothetical protein